MMVPMTGGPGSPPRSACRWYSWKKFFRLYPEKYFDFGVWHFQATPLRV